MMRLMIFPLGDLGMAPTNLTPPLSCLYGAALSVQYKKLVYINSKQHKMNSKQQKIVWNTEKNTTDTKSEEI